MDDRPLRLTRQSSATSDTSDRRGSAVSNSSTWAPEHSRGCCNKCAERFSILNRRHHCRMCGLLFCQKCSRFRVKLNSNSSKSRVCENCFPKALSGNSPPMNSFIHSRAWVPRGVFVQMLSYLDHVDLCLVSQACRWWYKRSSIDLVWRRLYDRQFQDDDEENSMSSFHREVHGIPFDSLPWKKKFAVRLSTIHAADKKKSFQAMSSLLSSMGLSKYAEVFEREEIDVESLCLMNAGHLRDLGIPTGPRLKLLNAAACLADLGEDSDDESEDEQEGSLESKSVTPASKLQQQKAKMKQYKASLVRKVQQSIVRIAVLTADGALCNVGSGTIIHEKGLIATARHCLVGEDFDCINYPDFMILVAPTESTSRPPLWKYRARAIPQCQDEELDCALLWLEGEVVSDPPCGLYFGDVTERIIARNWTITDITGSSFETLEKLPAVQIGNSNNLEPGDEMWMFGYPSSGHNTITVHHAICSGTDSMVYLGREVGKAWLRTAAQLDNGFSGGAAVDRKGQLVGLISFSVLRQDRVRAINMMKEFIEKAKADRLPGYTSRRASVAPVEPAV